MKSGDVYIQAGLRLESFLDGLKKLLLSCAVDDGNTVDDNDVIEAFVEWDGISVGGQVNRCHTMQVERQDLLD